MNCRHSWVFIVPWEADGSDFAWLARADAEGTALRLAVLSRDAVSSSVPILRL